MSHYVTYEKHLRIKLNEKNLLNESELDSIIQKEFSEYSIEKVNEYTFLVKFGESETNQHSGYSHESRFENTIDQAEMILEYNKEYIDEIEFLLWCTKDDYIDYGFKEYYGDFNVRFEKNEHGKVITRY